ncbi:hypothetical protein FT643_20430 [Ketobacter sp. MCCC 1A13808]|uniref:DUF6285 domain-containing protein n=1 Tax=Ketobacter sp. MCCC 1A13808 TaxID=2602738 RepID=UPI0012EB0BDD|nr:DUF6285 domain-containing protein [Ketobacter sp. MCCC 1A13808]MVF14508.1 hypothetical protein [Ketobacter sp. MCCC 1A13808]
MPLNRPTRIELLDAVESYLREPVTDAKADAFYRRVAGNVLAIVQRELLQANQFVMQERILLWTRLPECASATVIPTTEEQTQQACSEINQRLCDQIQQDEIAFDTRLTSTLLEIAQLKLAIDNPRHVV